MSLSRLFSIALLSAAATFAQTPGPAASIQIVADEDQVLVGRTLQLRAIVRDAQGVVRPNDIVTWNVNNVAFASINQGGELRATSLGVVRVVAQFQNIRVEVPIQTMPRDVQVTPRPNTINVGESIQFRAQAFDADGAPIPNVNFTWAVTNRNGGGTSLLRTNAAGLVTGAAEGGAIVRATYTYNESPVGMQRQWMINVPVEVTVPRKYELRRVYNNLQQMRSSFELRARPSMLWSAENGELYFNASLDGVTTSLLNWNYGEWRSVTTAALPRFVSATFTQDLRNHTILPGGQILTTEEVFGNGNQLSRGNKDNLEPFILNNSPLAGTESQGGVSITRNSHTTSGWTIVRANFRFPGSTITRTGLFRGFGSRITELLVHNGEEIAGLPASTTALPNIDGDFGITDDGVAIYSVTLGATRIFFRHQTERQRLIGVGDAMLGSTVRGFLGGQGNAPTFWTGENGDILLGIVNNDNAQYYLRYRAGAERPDSLRVSGQNGVLWHHPTAGSLLYVNPFNNQGNGAYVWRTDGSLEQLHVLGRTIAGQTSQAIESGTISGAARPTLMIRTNVSNMMIVRFQEDAPWVIAQHGDRINLNAPVSMLNFIGGSRTGNPMLQVGGSGGSIAELRGSDIVPVVAMGERLFGTQMYFGSSVNQSNWNARRAPNGDLYFTTGLGLGRVRASGSREAELFLRFPITQGNVTINAPFWVDANSNGDVFWVSSTNQGDNRLYVTPNGSANHREILAYSTAANTSTLDGRQVLAVDSYTIDDQARVLVNVRFRDNSNPALYLWNGQNWQALARVNETRFGNSLVGGIRNIQRAGGNRLYSLLSVAGGGDMLVDFSNPSTPQVLLRNTDTLMHGTVLNGITFFDVNRNGDVFYFHSAGTPYLMVRKGSAQQAEQQVVHNQFRATPEGDYLIRIMSLDFRDDGTIYFLGMNADDEQVIYVGRPL